MSGRRVAAIGLDAAEWSLVERMMADGDLPHLARLRSRSAVSTLHHADHRTGLVWEHFLAGKGAAGCGRMSVVDFDPETYATWKDGARPTPPFFASLPVRTVAFDVPYLSLGGDGLGDAVCVTAWGSHDPAYPRASLPPGMLRAIEAEVGPHPAFDNDYEIVWNRPQALESLADALVVGARRRADAALWLLRQVPDWQLFVTVLSEPHSAAEQLWHGVSDFPVNAAVDAPAAGRRLKEVYRAVDDAVGRLVAGLPEETTFVVFALHGAGTNDADVASMVLLPELLHRLATGSPVLRDPDQAAWAAAGYPPLVPPGDEPWHRYMARQVPEARAASVGDRVRAAVPAPVVSMLKQARAGLRPGARRHPPPANGRPPRVGALGLPIGEETTATPEKIGVPHDSLAWQTAVRYASAWPRMSAFAMPTFYDGRVRLNLEGRERDGVVPRDGYRQACDEVEAAVRACRDPRTGQPVVDEVLRLRADDPWAPGGPDVDLQVIWSHASDALAHPQAGMIGPFPFRRTGGHRSGGFVFVAGPGIEPADLGHNQALAVTATIVDLLGGDVGPYDSPPLPLSYRGSA